MKLRVVVTVVGLVLAVYVFLHIGIDGIVQAVRAVGWGGFAVLCAYSLGLFLILGAAWYVLLPDPASTRYSIFLMARMVRDAATEVLPFSQIGGIVIGARSAILRGVSQPLVFASSIVDVTTELLAQIIYVALGVLILGLRTSPTVFTSSLLRGLLIGLACAAAAAGLFLALQRRAHDLAVRIAAHIAPRALERTAAVSAMLESLYRDRARVGASIAFHFTGWMASAAGSWIAFRLVGAKVEFEAVLAIESLVCATRSAAVFIPHALGAQEAAYAVLSPLFGVGAEFGLAVSILKRTRDIATGVPILLIWHIVEAQRARAQTAA